MEQDNTISPWEIIVWQQGGKWKWEAVGHDDEGFECQRCKGKESTRAAALQAAAKFIGEQP